MNDNLFKRVENKTNISKDTILGLAAKLSNGNMKNKDTLMEVIDELSALTGRNVSDEKKEKIVNAIVNDKVPNNIDKSFWKREISFFSYVYLKNNVKKMNKVIDRMQNKP